MLVNAFGTRGATIDINGFHGVPAQQGTSQDVLPTIYWPKAIGSRSECGLYIYCGIMTHDRPHVHIASDF